MENREKRLVIVGGGLTGLSAAYYVRSMGKGLGFDLKITLIEKSSSLGGKVQTLHRDGFIIERGPDSFLARKPWMVELSKELGMDKEWVPTGPLAKNTYILHRGKLHPMPEGLMLGIPTRWRPFLQTGLISVPGKLRAAMDLFIPPQREQKDESLGRFLSRRLGREVSEHIAEPLLSGIYAGHPDYLSLNATFPQFREIEQRYGSLIRGFMQSQRSGKNNRNESRNGVPQSTFLSFKNGLASFVERLIQSLEKVEVLTGRGVTEISRRQDGYDLVLDDGSRYSCEAIICAVPAYAAARMLGNLADMTYLERLPYVSVANVAMAFGETVSLPAMNGSGFVVPRKEKRCFTACTWTSAKWPHTAPPGKTLLRVYVGRYGEEDFMQLSDEELFRLVRKELEEVMGGTFKPLFYEITRHPHSMPQYPVGHLEQLERIAEQLRLKAPGIWLCGAAYNGVGMPDCVRQGKEAAQQAIRYLTGG